MVRGIKWVDEVLLLSAVLVVAGSKAYSDSDSQVVEGSTYWPTTATLQQYECHFAAHGGMCLNATGWGSLASLLLFRWPIDCEGWPRSLWSVEASWQTEVCFFFISLPPNFRDCRIFSRTEGVSTTDIVNRWVWVAAVASFRFPFVSACCFAAAIVIFVKSTECSWWPETTTIKPTPSRQRCRSRQSRFAK